MNLLSLIGNTPIVPLRRLASPEGGAIYAKLEATSGNTDIETVDATLRGYMSAMKAIYDSE